MSSFRLLERPSRSGGWSDEEEPARLPTAKERAVAEPPKPSPARRIVEAAMQEGIAEEVFEELVDSLRRLHPFNPQVRYGDDGQVYVWLPEFSIYGQGQDFDEAAWGLVDEALEYVADWEQRLSGAPNHARREEWVHLLQLNRTPERVYRLLFGE